MSHSRTKSSSAAFARKTKQAVQLLHALGSPTRLLILQQLQTQRVASVGHIAQSLGMTHSAISHQLAVLAEAKLVEHEKDGREVNYVIAKSAEGRSAKRILRALGVSN